VQGIRHAPMRCTPIRCTPMRCIRAATRFEGGDRGQVQWMALAVRHFVVPIANKTGHGVGIDLADVHNLHVPLHAVDLSEIEAVW
jgi:hypothetical protein